MLQEGRLETSRAIKHTPSSLSPRQSQAQWDRLAWHDIMPCENKQGRYWKEDTERQGHPFSGNLSFPFPYWDLGDNWVTAGNRKTWALSTQCPSVPLCQQKSNHTNYFLIMVAVSAVKKGDRTIYKWLRPKLEDQQQLSVGGVGEGAEQPQHVQLMGAAEMCVCERLWIYGTCHANKENNDWDQRRCSGRDCFWLGHLDLAHLETLQRKLGIKKTGEEPGFVNLNFQCLWLL